MLMILLSGIVVGLASVVPIGPISMSVIGVAAHQGRPAGARAAAGVVGGEVIAAGAALGLALLGSRLPAAVLSMMQWAGVTLLVVVGALLIVRSDRLGALAGGLERPGSVLFALTAFSPVTIGSWLAILLASPFVASPSKLGLFVIGIIVASGLWHPALALGAATIGSRLSPPILTVLTRTGGVLMIVLAATLVALRP